MKEQAEIQRVADRQTSKEQAEIQRDVDRQIMMTLLILDKQRHIFNQ